MMKLFVAALALMSLPVRAAHAYEFDPEVWQLAVLSELMVAPAGVDAGVGQWIEIRNEASEPVNLQGTVIATLSGGFHVISPAKTMVLGPGGAFVFARAGDVDVNGGVEPDYIYGGELLLDPDEDVVFLLKGGVLVDLAAYGPESLSVKTGATFSLEPPPPGEKGFKQWCHGRESYGNAGNLGTPGQPNSFCDGDKDGEAEDQGDCDDDNPAVHPGALEVCNGLDDDCNGTVDDGLTAPYGCMDTGVCFGIDPECAGVSGFVCVYPDTWEEDETYCDGLDNDCDGETDEQLPLMDECLKVGVCDGSYAVCNGPDGLSCNYPSTYEPDEASCDGLDNDCDGETDEGFGLQEPCLSGVGACARTGIVVCSQGNAESVCSVDAGNPVMELCGDGLDNDCDGETDEDFPVSVNCYVGFGACRVLGKFQCSDDGISVECQAVPGMPVDEVCSDGIDNDCDDEIDEEDCVSLNGGSCASNGNRPGTQSWMLILALSMVTCVLRRKRCCTVTESTVDSSQSTV